MNEQELTAEIEIELAKLNGTAPTDEPAYEFESILPEDHFISRWISYAASRTDAAYEYHEAAALVLLAAATPNLRAQLSPYPNGLPTNLYVLIIGDSTTSRKSTSKDFAKDALSRAINGSLSPDHFSPEGFIEHLASRPNDCTTAFVDEFGELLEKLHHAKHMAQMRGILMTIYAGDDYQNKRTSKNKKGGGKVEDVDRVVRPHLSILGATTPAIFEVLSDQDTTSGLLPRFAIIMPAKKPPRRPFYEMDGESDSDINLLIVRLARLHAWTKDADRRVSFAPGVLEALDKFFESEFEKKAAERAENERIMLSRLQAMTVKVAMLIAAGRTGATDEDNLQVRDRDSEAAIKIVSRWAVDAIRFVERIGENDFERKLQKCLRMVRQRQKVRRKIIADFCRMDKKSLDMIQATLEDRGEIRVIETNQKGRKPLIEWEIGE